ncbi:Ig-like domain-containing protein [Neobacillus sp. 3P2-tot-E-2]|uniref:multiheme c-type cytochrome n=1 Tax=Neobacillus sp. 3P2-tot-E-2 TaxID=3132212 RepID=UPI0039A1B3C2
MRYRGLLHKTKLQVLIILVLCIQLLGPQQLFAISSVNSEGITGTEPTVDDSSKQEPEVTVTQPNADGSTDVPVGSVDNLSPENEIINDSTLPTINFIKPINGAYSNSRILVGTTEPSADVKICMDCKEDSEGLIIGTWISVLADDTGKWVYEDTQLTDGSHTVYAKVTDSAGNDANVNKVSFILDTSRPQVLPDVYPKQDMTRVEVNPTIKVKIIDANALDDSKEVIDKSITLSQNGTNIEGIINYKKETNEITFTPKAALKPGTKYNVFISPLGIIDAAKNNAFPRFWSFTTIGSESVEHQNPHGTYTNNVDTCGNCHSTHKAEDPNLLSPENVPGSDQKENLATDNYCMACHDGTVAAPMPENTQTAHTHNAAIDINGQQSGSSCASCHNPHLDWSEENPNLTQDHITYKHLPSNPIDLNKPTEEISSKEQMCESCHENDSAEKIANAAVEYNAFKYRKSSTAVGIYEDYELCLRCHNGDFKKKYGQIADIASHYDNLTEKMVEEYEKTNNQIFSERVISEVEKEFSGHILKALDGSPLAGHMPCAECHDTHGSNNFKQLKGSIGHEDIQSFSTITTDYITVKALVDSKELEFTILNESKEREFCLACHNGTTAVYGVKGQKYDATINEHNSNPSKSCSYCHGRGESEVEKALSAAHAPKKG